MRQFPENFISDFNAHRTLHAISKNKFDSCELHCREHSQGSDVFPQYSSYDIGMKKSWFMIVLALQNFGI